MNDIEWLAMAFVTPGGGILCMDLVNPTFKGSHPKDPSIARSNIIQVFLSGLIRLRLNGDFCMTTSAVMRRVLDHVLNTANENISWRRKDLDDLQLDFSFELFDTYHWMKQYPYDQALRN
ncbi:hypothetical protein V8C37DRAFT_67361 [Trichoderma ceciliae]